MSEEIAYWRQRYEHDAIGWKVLAERAETDLVAARATIHDLRNHVAAAQLDAQLMREERDEARAESARLLAGMRGASEEIDMLQAASGAAARTLLLKDARIAELEERNRRAAAEIARLTAALRKVARMKTIKGARMIVEGTIGAAP
jgi:hypothetical protein